VGEVLVEVVGPRIVRRRRVSVRRCGVGAKGGAYDCVGGLMQGGGGDIHRRGGRAFLGYGFAWDRLYGGRGQVDGRGICDVVGAPSPRMHE